MSSSGPSRRPVATIAARRDSISVRVYEDLRDRLQAGDVGPDDRLVDVEIAQRLGVSRMPVREALLQLTHEGYLVNTTRGYRVPSLTREDIAEIFEVRRLIEPRAAALAARDLTPLGIERLTAALAGSRAAMAAGSFDGMIRANAAFRGTWLAAVGNRRLSSTIQRFVDQVQVVRFGTLRDPDTQRIVIDGLAGLHDAFARHDSIAAQDRMAAFIAAAEASFFLGLGAEAARTTEKTARTGIGS